VQRTDAIPVALDALHGQGDKQARLLQMLLQDVQMARVENNQLHDATYRMIRERTQAILNAQAQDDSALAAQLRAILDAVQRWEATARPTTIGGISIGGNAGTVQNVTISGGTVSGPIIGSQHTYYAAQPRVSQDAIDDAESDLVIQRQQAAKARRRSSPQDLAQAQEKIRRLKAQIRGWGRMVIDEPGDER
jgi:hypothetical protein